MNRAQIYISIIFIVLSVTGAILGYRTMTDMGDKSSQAGSSLDQGSLASRRNSISAKGGAMPSMEVLLSDLEDATTKADLERLEYIRTKWLPQCSREQLDELIAFIGSESDSQRKGLMMGVVAGRWAEFAPQEAIDFMLTNIHEAHCDEGFQRIFEVLAVEDPVVALDLISDIHLKTSDPSVMGLAVLSIFNEWKKSDPSAAFSALPEITNAKDQWMALVALSQIEDPNDQPQLFANIRSLEDPKLKQQAWKLAIRYWSQKAPFTEVAEWLRKQSFDRNLASHLEREVAAQKGAQDPKAMAEWLVSRADERSLPGHLKTAVDFWAANHPNACGQWLNQLEPGPHADQAITSYAHAILRKDAPSAFAWAQSVKDEKLRRQTLQRVANRFYFYDSQGLIKAVTESNLPADYQAELIEASRKAAAGQ